MDSSSYSSYSSYYIYPLLPVIVCSWFFLIIITYGHVDGYICVISYSLVFESGVSPSDIFEDNFHLEFLLRLHLCVHSVYIGGQYWTCSSPRQAVCSHYLVCSKNSLLIVGIVPIHNKELELIFRSDCSDRMCVHSQVSGLHDKLCIYKREEKCIVF